MADPSALPGLTVTVAWCSAPGVVQEWTGVLPAGACVADALEAAPWPLAGGEAVGVWGRTVERSHALRAGDRVEIYRPLKVDPKRARRERFARQGTRGAGLFARNRSND